MRQMTGIIQRMFAMFLFSARHAELRYHPETLVHLTDDQATLRN